MKNKSTMLLLGIGIAYIIYRMYAKKTTAQVTTTNAVPKLFYTTENLLELQGKEEVLYPNLDIDKGTNVTKETTLATTKNDEVILIPSTYQTFYGKLNGTNRKVPSTC